MAKAPTLSQALGAENWEKVKKDPKTKDVIRNCYAGEVTVGELVILSKVLNTTVRDLCFQILPLINAHHA